MRVEYSFEFVFLHARWLFSKSFYNFVKQRYQIGYARLVSVFFLSVIIINIITIIVVLNE